jgi:hypothetical protein
LKLSKDVKLLFYFFLLLLITWGIFDSLKMIWSDDTFQKVILAPLGEESYKILAALLMSLFVYIGFNIPMKYGKNKDKIKKIDFLPIFYYTFIPFAITSGVIFGVSEGPIPNILLHFSTTTLAAISIILIFKKVKDKSWKIYYKVLAMFSSMILPMFFHSIQNQYANIVYANNHPEFNYLVVIGRYLEQNTILSNHVRFAFALFIITLVVLYILSMKWIFQKNKQKDLIRNHF